MIYVVGGLALAIFYTATALGIAIWQTDLHWFGDITLACQVTLSPLDQCRLDTIAVGWETLAGLCLAALMLITTRFLAQGRQTVKRWALPPNTFERSILYRLFIIGVLTLLCAHFITRITGPDQLGRLAMIEREGIFTSLENLCWPILLQLYVTDRSRIGRYFALTLLLVVASLAFFRGTLLLILIFGIGLYLLDFIWCILNRRNHWKRYRPILTERLIIGIIVSLLLIPAIITDSASRKAYVLSGQSTTDISSVARQPTSSLQTSDPTPFCPQVWVSGRLCSESCPHSTMQAWPGSLLTLFHHQRHGTVWHENYACPISQILMSTSIMPSIPATQQAKQQACFLEKGPHGQQLHLSFGSFQPYCFSFFSHWQESMLGFLSDCWLGWLFGVVTREGSSTFSPLSCCKLSPSP
ncbi:hypothetical protein DJ030_07400 [bacterium endosymbiont of Escarpia laminata]|nr:MAG: hypothetical protein DJ030_07400 [bacterium endosymbiont of Escarpia laminata]